MPAACRIFGGCSGRLEHRPLHLLDRKPSHTVLLWQCSLPVFLRKRTRHSSRVQGLVTLHVQISPASSLLHVAALLHLLSSLPVEQLATVLAMPSHHCCASISMYTYTLTPADLGAVCHVAWCLSLGPLCPMPLSMCTQTHLHLDPQATHRTSPLHHSPHLYTSRRHSPTFSCSPPRRPGSAHCRTATANPS